MTRTNSRPEAVAGGARRRRRLALGVFAVATTLGSTTIASVALPTVASAASKSSSASIAAEANVALDALIQWQATARLTDYSRFVEARNTTATMTASVLQVSGTELGTAWGDVALPKQHVLLAALTQLGVPYRNRTSKPGEGFDCSGLMLYAYGHAGITLPRSSGDQIRAATEVDDSDAEPGDLVFYPGHISMYLGLDLMVHSPQSGETVEVRHLFDRSLRFGDAVNALVAAAPAPVAGPVATAAPAATAITPRSAEY